MNKDINAVEFTIFDTETTGLDPNSGDRIVEIAGLRIKGDDKLGSFQSLINCGRDISQAAYAVNKISASMLKDAPAPAVVIPEFLKFAQDSCLCSYNAGFDWAFLNNELKLLGLPPANHLQILDILKMARRTLPNLERYALWFVADKLGIKTEQLHRAFSDVELTLSVFTKLKVIALSKGICDFNHFSRLFSVNQVFLRDMNMQKLAEIQQAIDLKLNLKIKYFSSSNATVSEREVVPKEIKQENGRAYLVGYCLLRKEERTFLIDGILHLQIL